jgi:hypothetical protein
MDAIKLEMQNVRVAVEEFDGDPNTLVACTQITGHLVFDVKLGENFRRKARYCADGHKTGASASVTYNEHTPSLSLFSLTPSSSGIHSQRLPINPVLTNI